MGANLEEIRRWYLRERGAGVAHKVLRDLREFFQFRVRAGWYSRMRRARSGEVRGRKMMRNRHKGEHGRQNAKALGLVLFLTMMLGAPSVDACSCMMPRAPSEALAKAGAVFAGRVVSVDVPRGVAIPEGIVTGSMDPVRIGFEVERVWKGSVTRSTTVTTARSGASCGFEFQTGRTYLVYASGSDTLFVSLCSRTTEMPLAKDDLADLGEGSTP